MGYQHQDQHPPPVFQTQQSYQPYPNHTPPNSYQFSYPQQPPPPAAYYYQQHYTHVTRGAGCYRCFCCCICFIIVIVIIVSLIILINWLILRPQIPTFRVTKAISYLNTTTKPLDAKWLVNVTVDNTNKEAKMYLDDIDTVLFYNGYSVGNSKVPPFTIEKGEKKDMEVYVRHKEMEAILESDLMYDMNNELAVRSSLKLKLKVYVKAELKAKGKLKRKPVIKFLCKGLEVKYNWSDSMGELVPGKEYDCKINPVVLAFGTDFGHGN